MQGREKYMTKSSQKKSFFERLFGPLLRKPRNREELTSVLAETEHSGIINHDAFNMIQGVLQVSNMKVRDAMIHRQQMVMIPAEATYETALPIMIGSGHSRFPVIGET